MKKSVTVLLGITACGISGYLMYIFLKNKEKDDEEDELNPKLKNQKCVEIKIPQDLIGAFIGRNGKNIKEIQSKSFTKIICKNASSNVFLIKGDEENCKIALNMVEEFIKNRPALLCEDFYVDNAFVGKIIGRCGEKINEIQSLSGAKVTVINFEDDNKEARVNLQQRRVVIRGTKDQILVAKSLIEDTIEQAQRSTQILEKRQPRLPSKSPESKKKLNSPKFERISPIPSDKQFEVYVSAMANPSQFWLQIVGPKASELDCLVEEMTEYYNHDENRLLHTLDNVDKGDLVAAVFQYDKKWYRAEVLNVVDKEEDNGDVVKSAELYYVDYGDTDVVSVEDLYELRTDFLQLHFQAIECFLAKVEPKDGGEWSESAIDKFEELTHVAQWKKLSAKIDGYETREKKTRAKRENSPVPGVDLFDISDESDVNVGEELVKSGLAVYKLLSKNATNNSSRAESISNISVASSS